MVSLWERWANKTMNSQSERGKTEKFLKPILKKTIIVQNTRFLWLKWIANKSPNQVAKKPLRQNLKNLSKCFSRLGSPLVSKSRRKLQIILSKLVTGASTRKPIAKLGHGNVKNPEIFKFFYVFFVTRGLTCQKSTRNWGLATGVTCKNESPEQSCTVFEIFDIFQNKNTFQKQLKYLKIILCLINIWLSKCNTFN